MPQIVLDMQTVTDLDGVLCPDCDPRLLDDGPLWSAWAAKVPALFEPSPEGVLAIVTARPERWRALTESWLAMRGIAYGRLIMFPESARDAGVAVWKASCFASVRGAERFVESDPEQARVIARITKMPVFCPSQGA
jgi:hypothetical protein